MLPSAVVNRSVLPRSSWCYSFLIICISFFGIAVDPSLSSFALLLSLQFVCLLRIFLVHWFFIRCDAGDVSLLLLSRLILCVINCISSFQTLSSIKWVWFPNGYFHPCKHRFFPPFKVTANSHWCLHSLMTTVFKSLLLRGQNRPGITLTKECVQCPFLPHSERISVFHRLLEVATQ